MVAVAGGALHSLAVRSDGTVWAWGDNAYGQLGDDTLSDRTTPVQVRGLTGVMSISAGYAHALVVRSDGTVWAWGWNSSGQLGDGTTVNRSAPVQVQGVSAASDVAAGGYSQSLAVRSDGTVWRLGSSAPAQVLGVNGVVTGAAGVNHSLAMTSDGTLWAWGVNTEGQFGNGLPVYATTAIRSLLYGALSHRSERKLTCPSSTPWGAPSSQGSSVSFPRALPHAG
ncbi:MAG TPA: hypothetical protein VEU50_21100 [Archangium sp.]|nr:hypothetical protein [Archangium sp.]HYO55288.1 hypothetical protein [Archangium sp.]